LIIDDGSSDSVALDKVVTELSDARFRVIHRPNGGGGAARNTGIDAAAGRFIAFLDSDDLFLPDKLQLTYEFIRELKDPDSAVVFSQVIVDRGVGRYWIKPPRAPGTSERIDEYLILRQGFIQTSTITLSASAAARTRFDETLSFGQDTDFCIRLAANGHRFYMLPQPQTIWKDDTVAGRVSSNRRLEQILAWSDKNSALLSRRSYLAYRGWHGAKAAMGANPRAGISLFLRALINGAFPPTLAARVALQVFVPPSLYRRLANFFVATFGKGGKTER